MWNIVWVFSILPDTLSFNSIQFLNMKKSDVNKLNQNKLKGPHHQSSNP